MTATMRAASTSAFRATPTLSLSQSPSTNTGRLWTLFVWPATHHAYLPTRTRGTLGLPAARPRFDRP
jgi:hypothetical protein